MKITHVTTRVLDTLDETPLVAGLPEPLEHTGPRQLLTVELGTDEGVVGLGVTFWHGALSPALKTALDVLADLTIGHDPRQVEAVAARLRHATGRTSAEGAGIFNLALAAIDLACWDMRGKARMQSVGVRLPRRAARSRPAYASGALLRGFGLDDLSRAARTLVSMGFRQVKLQCGSEASPAESIERVRVIREAAGPHVAVMCDINQLWSVHQAIEMGRRLEPYQLSWLEDPTIPDDMPGLARIAAALDTPITAGEYATRCPFRHLLEARACDIVMIDLLRVGGVSGWLKVASLAAVFNLPVVSHLLPEIQVQLVAAVPNGLTVEYRPLTSGIFCSVPALVDGELVLPDGSGLGLELSPEAVARYQVA